ncbi:thiamine biosynthesis ThiH domain protein [Clostridioides difficile DA00165]|nr:thiamine biosynthesis ThiH domain protein [Clostridioides difficile DA00165]
MFINHELINSLLEDAKNSTSDDIEKVLDKADRREKLSYKDIATLLEVEDKKQLDRLFSIAGQIKMKYMVIEWFYLPLFMYQTTV